jgi:hypothetical protein
MVGSNMIVTDRLVVSALESRLKDSNLCNT